jgi:hypothetical protein
MKRVVKHELIEVIVPAGSTATRFQLPDAQNLRNVQTWGIQVYYDKIVPNSIVSGFPLIDKTTFLYSFLTLQNYAGREFDKQSPLSKYQTIENDLSTVPGGADASIQEKDFKNFVGQKINFPKSWIDTVFPIGKDLTEPLVFLISVYYTDKGETFSQTSFDQKH